MSDSIIAQVKRLAEAQKKWGTTSCFILDANINVRFNVNFPALLAHMQAQQAVVDAAREVHKEIGEPTDGDDISLTWSGAEACRKLGRALEKESNGKG